MPLLSGGIRVTKVKVPASPKEPKVQESNVYKTVAGYKKYAGSSGKTKFSCSQGCTKNLLICVAEAKGPTFPQETDIQSPRCGCVGLCGMLGGSHSSGWQMFEN